MKSTLRVTIRYSLDDTFQQEYLHQVHQANSSSFGFFVCKIVYCSYFVLWYLSRALPSLSYWPNKRSKNHSHLYSFWHLRSCVQLIVPRRKMEAACFIKRCSTVSWTSQFTRWFRAQHRCSGSTGTGPESNQEAFSAASKHFYFFLTLTFQHICILYSRVPEMWS